MVNSAHCAAPVLPASILRSESGDWHPHVVTYITKLVTFVFLVVFGARASDGDVIAITVLMILPRYKPARQMKHTPLSSRLWLSGSPIWFNIGERKIRLSLQKWFVVPLTNFNIGYCGDS
jgi:hypothetical protein